MGGEMLVGFIAFKEGSDLAIIREAMIQRALLATPEELDEYYSEEYGDNLDDYCEQQKIEGDHLGHGRDELVNVIEEALKESTLNDRRDVTFFEFLGYTLYITGGMSWGDAPTDAYTIFEKFNYLPLRIREGLGIV